MAVITNIATNIATAFITDNLDAERFNAAVPASLAGFALTLLATLKLQKWTLSDLGFHAIQHTRKYLFWQVPAIVAANFTLVALMLMTPLANTGGREEIANTLKLGPIGFSVSIFTISIVAPIMEEIYYRRFIMGYLEQKLLPRMQARTAIICSTLISSVLFALMHGVPMAMITAFFLGPAQRHSFGGTNPSGPVWPCTLPTTPWCPWFRSSSTSPALTCWANR